MSGPVRPSGYIGWCATGATNVTEPTDAQKAVGWGVGQAPPSSYENWILQKQDQWIQYLGWRAGLATVIVDDFLLPSQINGGQSIPIDGASGSISPWFALQPSGKNAYGYLTGNIMSLGSYLGVRTLESNLVGGSVLPGWGEFYRVIDLPMGRDFKFDFNALDYLRPIGTTSSSQGGSVEFGMFYAHSGLSGANPQAAFMWTGASGAAVGFAWNPSGLGPTSVSLGNIPSGGTGFHRFTVENRSPTMAIYVDGVLAAAAPSPKAVGVSGYPMVFGARFGSPPLPGSPTSCLAAVWLDRAELYVDRSR